VGPWRSYGRFVLFATYIIETKTLYIPPLHIGKGGGHYVGVPGPGRYFRVHVRCVGGPGVYWWRGKNMKKKKIVFYNTEKVLFVIVKISLKRK